MSSIEERVKRIVAEQLSLKPEEIKSESSFVDDLGADSLDTVELVMALEEEFEAEIPDEKAESITTVASAISYIEEHINDKSSAKKVDEADKKQPEAAKTEAKAAEEPSTGKAADATADAANVKPAESADKASPAPAVETPKVEVEKAAPAPAEDKKEAEALAKEAERKTEEYVTRRTALAEQKIEQAEGQAVAEVKSLAVDIAMEAAESVISRKVSGAAANDLFKKSLGEIKQRMN